MYRRGTLAAISCSVFDYFSVARLAGVFKMNIEEIIACVEGSNMESEAKAETMEIIRWAVSE